MTQAGGHLLGLPGTWGLKADGCACWYAAERPYDLGILQSSPACGTPQPAGCHGSPAPGERRYTWRTPLSHRPARWPGPGRPGWPPLDLHKLSASQGASRVATHGLHVSLTCVTVKTTPCVPQHSADLRIARGNAAAVTAAGVHLCCWEEAGRGSPGSLAAAPAAGVCCPRLGPWSRCTQRAGVSRARFEPSPLMSLHHDMLPCQQVIMTSDTAECAELGFMAQLLESTSSRACAIADR